MAWTLGILAVAVSAYLLVLLGLFVFQRKLMYFPAERQAAMPTTMLPQARMLRLKTSDGQSIVAWYQPAAAHHRLYLYFHGNGGSLAGRVDLFCDLTSDGSGFFAIDYRGYGGSSGSPTERGLILDGEAAYREVSTLGYDPSRIVIIGESLGTGVAVAVAAEHPASALVLDSAFSSTADVAAGEYPMFPVRALMSDSYDSLSRIGEVIAPKLFLHGTADPVIPIALGRKLFDAAAPPKKFIELKGAGHVVLGQPNAVERMQAWLASLPPLEAAPIPSGVSKR